MLTKMAAVLLMSAALGVSWFRQATLAEAQTTVTVFQSPQNARIPNALVEFGGQSAFTDGNGDAFFMLPMKGTFALTVHFPTCTRTYDWLQTGSPMGQHIFAFSGDCR